MELSHDGHITLLLYFMLVWVDDGVSEQVHLFSFHVGAAEAIPI